MGLVDKANNEYQILINKAESKEEKWKVIVEYLPLLYSSHKYEMTKKYSDSLVCCYSDSNHSFRDVRSMYYLLVNINENNCSGMYSYLDSIKSIHSHSRSSLLTEESIRYFEDTISHVCKTLN